MWQTEAPGVAEHERALGAHGVPTARRSSAGSRLRRGRHAEPPGATGLDLFEEKVRFARARLPDCRFVTGSVYELPFADAAFDHVLVRDVIHHLEHPSRLVDEAARVLEDGGRLDVLEPCRYNPLIFAHALAVKAERGELRSSVGFLRELLGARFRVTSVQTLQGFPLHRLVFHPDLGRPKWGAGGPIKRFVDAVEGLADRLIPRFARAYIHVRAVKT